MTWKEYLLNKESYKNTWRKLKDDFAGEVREYLNKAYLVVACDTFQMPFDDREAYSVAIEYPAFFVKDAKSARFLEIAKLCKEGKDTEQDRKRELMRELEKIDASGFSIVPFQVEVRFDSLRFSFIQQVKQSPHCDKGLTDMSTVSIRVVIKEPEL